MFRSWQIRLACWASLAFTLWLICLASSRPLPPPLTETLRAERQRLEKSIAQLNADISDKRGQLIEIRFRTEFSGKNRMPYRVLTAEDREYRQIAAEMPQL
jgi:hypothetical protein